MVQFARREKNEINRSDRSDRILARDQRWIVSALAEVCALPRPYMEVCPRPMHKQLTFLAERDL